MFGLVALEHTLHPDTTLTKIEFLIQNVFTHYHHTTTIISFGALMILIFLRTSKSMFSKYWWIYRLPEVLLVVVVSTCTSLHHPCHLSLTIHTSFSPFRRVQVG